MRQTPIRVILLIFLFALSSGQSQAFFTSKTCDEQQESLHSQSAVAETNHEQADEDDCCGVDCCKPGCLCSQGLCSVAVYLATNIYNTNHLFLSESITRQQTEYPNFISHSLYRPPIYTSQG